MIEDAIVVDGHMDTPLRMVDEGIDLVRGSARVHADLPRMREAGLDAAFFAAWIDPELAPEGALARCEALLGAVRELARSHPERVALADSAEAVRALAGSGRLALLAGVENGQAIEGDPGNLERLRVLGVRYLTLTWMNSNELGDAGGGERLHGGLSRLGREVVRRMERLGILVDLAHAAPSTFRDAIAIATRPVAVTHAATEARGAHFRNLTDDQIRAVAATGGVVGVAFMPEYLTPHDPGAADVTSIGDHLERIVEVGGIETAALGSDLDGVPALPRGIRGVEDYPSVAGALAERGFGESERAAVLGGNWLRLLDSLDA
ncbi:MAG: dipeptidase [Gemmatimonadota bacterium]|nr:dipeptidase [Gemmatimonadota bacterium]